MQYLISTSDEDDDYEEFPGRAVVNLQKLRKHVQEQFKMNPNPYVEKQKIEHVPKYFVDKEAERNDVQRQPQYGWAQMYLSLCLNCSKDYILLRNNQAVWEKFIDRILCEDVEDEDTVRIPIGNKELCFTAIHLAEIQTIMELEKSIKGEV